MMSRKVCILFAFVVQVLLVCLCACEHVSDVEREQIYSLNRLAYEVKYKSLDESEGYVNEVLTRYSESLYRDGLQEALLGKGDVYGMRMEYDSAKICYQEVLDATNNDLLGSMADVNMMSVCLMTAMNKEFYNYRSDAQERMANVAEESSDMTEHQFALWKAVQTDYHFVSANYFIKMRQDEGAEEEFDWLEDHQDLFMADTARYAAYLFLRSIHGGNVGNTSEAADEMQGSLTRLLSLSKRSGYIYFEASALNALAKSVMKGGGMRPSRWVFIEEMIGEPGFFPFEYRLANRALRLAEQYGNDFVRTTALVTLSDYYLKEGKDTLALVQMKKALELINENHRVNCVKGCAANSHEELYAYAEEEDTLSTEMKWISDPDVVAVPEWMAMVREQLSVVYGAMGMKAASDYNHNIFFDILDVTRQDLRVEQEEENLVKEERMLNFLLWFFVLLIMVLSWLLYLYYKRSRQEYHKKVEMLSQVIDICKRLSSALTEEMEDEEDLDQALHAIADKDVERLFPQVKGQDWTKVEPAQMKGLDKELFHVLLVFYNWMRQKGLLFIQFAQQQRQLEGETYVFEKRLEENKRQYIEKLTSMSIVHGITPFLDRALHEVNKLKLDVRATPAMVRERFLYLSELIDKINEYNDVLGHWVKIRQGMVTLNIENFALQPLFDTMKRGTRTFENKGVALTVEDTRCVVKADKSLTLFMMNTLLDNARKYTPEGGHVELSAVETDTYVEVSVADTGHGMSPEDVDTLNNAKVYDSSKIGSEGEHASSIRKNKGFGFGLMNCKGIIGKYKKTNAMFQVCEFGVESQLGKGSRFFFRLPKGVIKALMVVIIMMCAGGTLHAENPMERAADYVDSVFLSNVAGNHEQAILYADSAIQCFNKHYKEQVPKGTKLMSLEGGEMAELEWWKAKLDSDYELMIGLRNEVAIAALALNRNSLYHYNSEIFTRLYKLTSTDPTLEDYCNSIKMANRNKKTAAILLGILIFLVLVTYFFLYYRNNQLFVFNLRQFIQLNNKVFTSSEETLFKVLHQSLSDIKTVDTVGMMIPAEDRSESFRFVFTGLKGEQSVYESMMQAAYNQKKEMTSSNGHFHAYPLFVPGLANQSLVGVLGVRFYDGELTDEESLIMNLVAQFMSIHTYFSYHKVGEMNELIELKRDEKIRMDNEQQKVYVRNQIMDNSLSTLKHETMYYPNRIKQLVDEVLKTPDAAIGEITIRDIDELLTYYKDVFTILSTCAGKQVEMTLFKRTTLSAKAIGEMVVRSFKKQGKNLKRSTKVKVSEVKNIAVQGDRIFLQVLVDNIISLYFEHNSGGDLLLDFEVSEGFAKFVFTDVAYRYGDDAIPQLFYVDHVRYDAKTDTLLGAQYLICRQIIREHDAHSSLRGCRIYVENCDVDKGSRFVFSLPLSSMFFPDDRLKKIN